MKSFNRPSLNPQPSALKQHLWVALALTAMALAAYTGVAYGNSYGGDDWAHVYHSCQLHGMEMVGRPLALLIVGGICSFFGTQPLVYHLALLGFRAASAFLLYLLIWQISPNQGLFAFACGAASTTVLVHDSSFVATLLQQTDHVASVILTLLALNAFTAYLYSEGSWLGRAGWLVLSLILVGVTPLVREATFPLLFTIPLLVSVAHWHWSRSRLAGLVAWNGVIILGAVRFIEALRQLNYISGTFKDLNIDRMLSASQNQLDFAFRVITQLSMHDIFPFQPAIFVAVVVTVAGFLIVRRLIVPTEDAKSRLKQGLVFIVWIAVGLLTTWLGLAAFLPSALATSPTRTHVLSFAGEAITLMGVTWLVSSLIVNHWWKAAIQLAGLMWVSAHGAMFANLTQQELDQYAATWQNAAYFWRSLANIAPAFKVPTLLIYVENPAIEEAPLVYGWNFQYGLRYFYNDQATGIVPTDNPFGEWTVSDKGILFQEIWIDQPHLFGWDAIVFTTRDNSGRILVLDKLPERFLTAYRQSLYHPHERILTGFIPPRIQAAFPILSGPDWAQDDALVRH